MTTHQDFSTRRGPADTLQALWMVDLNGKTHRVTPRNFKILIGLDNGYADFGIMFENGKIARFRGTVSEREAILSLCDPAYLKRARSEPRPNVA